MCSLMYHSSVLPGYRSLQKRICAVVIFCPKKIVTVLAVFLSFWSWLTDFPCFHKFERQSCLFGVDNAFFTCWCYLGVLNNWLHFFLWNHVFLCVYQWCGFSRYKIFHFWSQCLADIFTSMCSFLFVFQFYWGSGHCASEFELECFCLNKVITNW